MMRRATAGPGRRRRPIPSSSSMPSAGAATRRTSRSATVPTHRSTLTGPRRATVSRTSMERTLSGGRPSHLPTTSISACTPGSACGPVASGTLSGSPQTLMPGTPPLKRPATARRGAWSSTTTRPGKAIEPDPGKVHCRHRLPTPRGARAALGPGRYTGGIS